MVTSLPKFSKKKEKRKKKRCPLTGGPWAPGAPSDPAGPYKQQEKYIYIYYFHSKNKKMVNILNKFD